MEGPNPTPYLFVKEIFLNIIIALRRLFIIIFLYFKCFYYSNFPCVFVFCCCILSFLFLVFLSFTFNSFHYQIIQHVRGPFGKFVAWHRNSTVRK